MKTYEVFSTTGGAIAEGGTHSASVTMENPGRYLQYALAVKGDIADADVIVDVEIPGDAEVYNTALKGQSQLTTLDLTNGGEIRATENQSELAVLRVAESVTVTVRNNDASAGDATVKILQYEAPS